MDQTQIICFLYENISTHIDEIGNSDFITCRDYHLVLDPNIDTVLPAKSDSDFMFCLQSIIVK